MSSDTKLIIGVVISSVILLVGAVAFLSRTPTTPISQTSSANFTPRDDSYNSDGAENPNVTIVEFSDFQCPACKSTAPLLKQILSVYPNQVKLIYQHFPLPQHQYARVAAQAAEAAGSQNKFWEMHDLLFANQDNFNEELIAQLSGQIDGLDTDKFKSEWQTDLTAQKVTQDLTTANSINVDSTPTIYVNGIKFTDAPSFENLQKAVDAELAKSSANTINIATDSGILNIKTETPEATPSAN